MKSTIEFVKDLFGWNKTPDKNNQYSKRRRVNEEFEEEIAYRKKYITETQFSNHKVTSKGLIHGKDSDKDQFVHNISPRIDVSIQIDGRIPVITACNKRAARTVANENTDDDKTRAPIFKTDNPLRRSVITHSKNQLNSQIDDEPENNTLITEEEDNAESREQLRSSTPYQLDRSKTQPDIASGTNDSVTEADHSKVFNMAMKLMEQAAKEKKLAKRRHRSSGNHRSPFDISRKRLNKLIKKQNTKAKTRIFQNPLFNWISSSKKGKQPDGKNLSKYANVNKSLSHISNPVSDPQLKEQVGAKSRTISNLARVNTLEDYFKSQALYNCNFLNVTNSKYNAINNMYKEKLSEVTLESDMLSKVNKEILLKRKLRAMAITIDEVMGEESVLQIMDLAPV